MRLSIIIPAHNEEGRIGRMLDAYLPFFIERYGDDVEFVAVVNGSRDRTEEVVREYERRYPQLRRIVEPRRVGKGGALMLGLADARGDRIGFADADGSTPPEAFQDLVDRMGDADAIIASRWRRGARVRPRQPVLRRVASRVFNLLTRMLFGLRLTDTQCGAKLFTRETVREVLPTLGITRWAFDVDLLFQVRRAGRTVREIPTTWHDVAGSKIEVGRVSTEMAAALVRLRLIYSPFSWVVTLYDRFLGPFIHPPGLQHDRLFRHSLLLLAGAQVGNISNLLFHLVMVRMLQEVQYGVLAAMLGLFAIIRIPLNSLGRTTSHFAAKSIRDGRRTEAVSFGIRLARDVSIVALPVLVFVLFRLRAVTGFFHLDSTLPVLLTCMALVVALYQPIALGLLVGAQAFVWSTVINISWSMLRFVLAVGLVLAVGAASGALTAHLVALLASVLLALFAVAQVIGFRPSGAVRVPRAHAYFLRYMAALAGYSILVRLDLVLVKHYFEAEQAALFAKAVLVARTIIFLPAPIAGAMFPKVVSTGDPSYGAGRTLLKAVVLVGSLVLTASLFCTAFPRLVLGVVAGDTSPALVPLMRGMVWAFAPLTIVFLLMNFELAQGRYRVPLPLLACAAAYVAGVVLFHATLMQVIAVLGTVSATAVLLIAACIPWGPLFRKEAPA